MVSRQGMAACATSDGGDRQLVPKGPTDPANGSRPTGTPT